MQRTRLKPEEDDVIQSSLGRMWLTLVEGAISFWFLNSITFDIKQESWQSRKGWSHDVLLVCLVIRSTWHSYFDWVSEERTPVLCAAIYPSTSVQTPLRFRKSGVTAPLAYITTLLSKGLLKLIKCVAYLSLVMWRLSPQLPSWHLAVCETRVREIQISIWSILSIRLQTQIMRLRNQ